MSDIFWMTPGEGVLTLKEGKEKVYSNEKFISECEKSSSPVSRLVLSSHPSPVEIRLMGDTTPPVWREFTIDKIDTNAIASNFVIPIEEVPSNKRLMLSRGKISDRSRNLAPYAGLQITPRGVKDDGIGEDVSQMITRIVYSLAFIIERNTVASLKGASRHVSPEKKIKILRIIDILKNREHVSEVILINSYISPAPIVAKRLYSLGTIYGIEEINDIIDSLYYDIFKEQILSVLGLKDIV